ncbi:hypothetical protein PybrP1_008824 [[Pythium] brassicae (nom. inval.)]|nr:hypothetical protein PybrP1_008824 [[Pythium] brassicae (nom. inval.)]
MRSVQVERMRSLSDLPRLHEFEKAMQMEIAQADGREEMFLRSSSGLSALFKTLGHEHARPYLRYALRDVFGEKSTLYTRTAITTPGQVREYAQNVIGRLTKALQYAPLVLRAACKFVLREYRKAFPASQQHTTIVVGGVVFLRLVNPALIKPEMLGFPPHTVRSLPVCVQIAKMLQHTLSGNLLNENAPECALGNVFITQFQPQVASFLEDFTQVCLEPQPQEAPLPSPRSADVLCLKPWDMDSAPPTPTNSWEMHPSKLRGMSLSATMFDAADVTCVAADPRGSCACVFAGDANGILRCFVKETEGGRITSTAGQVEAPLVLQWTARAAQDAVLSVCAALDLRARDGAGVLLLVGTATGELVFFRNEMEMRRVQLESAVLSICALAGSESEFVVGDLLGTLYGVNQYGVLWSRTRERVRSGVLLPAAKAANLYEVDARHAACELTLCVCWLTRVSGACALLVTSQSDRECECSGRRGHALDVRAREHWRAPVAADAPRGGGRSHSGEHAGEHDCKFRSGSHGREAAERGSCGRGSRVRFLTYTRALGPRYLCEWNANRGLTMTKCIGSRRPVSQRSNLLWTTGQRCERRPLLRTVDELSRLSCSSCRVAQVAFPVAKIFRVGSGVPGSSEDDSNAESESFSWVCVGATGRVVLFDGKRLIREWDAAGSRTVESIRGCLVDSAVLHEGGDSSKEDAMSLVVAFSSHVEVFSITS